MLAAEMSLQNLVCQRHVFAVGAFDFGLRTNSRLPFIFANGTVTLLPGFLANPQAREDIIAATEEIGEEVDFFFGRGVLGERCLVGFVKQIEIGSQLFQLGDSQITRLI